MRKHRYRGERGLHIFFWLWLTFSLVLFGLGVYVAVHFITKYW